ncbi:MAG: endonuclease III domain-containing protein [Planctomycetota bacterium]
MPRPTRLRLSVPADFSLAQAVCSYGYFLLAPNRWRPGEQAYERRFQPAELSVANPAGGNAHVFVSVVQPRGVGSPLAVRCDRALASAESVGLRRVLRRTLRLDTDLAAWFRRSATARRRGFGRLFRSPTLFEDMVKTITNCNVAWPSTVRMNRLLVDRLGDGAFPTPAQLARLTPSRLKARCGVGYRAKRIVGLARRFDSGDLDPAWFESPERSVDELRTAIRALDGFGPYATANVLQLLGHYEHLPIDTETIRLFCKLTGTDRPSNDVHLHVAIERRYARYGRHRFLAYWFELWRDYESMAGPSVEWDPDDVASRFTASRLTQEG